MARQWRIRKMPSIYQAPPLTKEQKKALRKQQREQRYHYEDDGISGSEGEDYYEDGELALC